MKKSWFKPFGWFYVPVSIKGWIITIITLALCVQFFLAVDRRSHSVSDTLIGVFPYEALFIIIVGWIASRTSGAKKQE